jgi:hypothetical protein
MWRATLAALLSVSIVQAQVGARLSTVHPEPIALDPSSFSGNWIGIFTEHSAFRRGTEERILLQPDLNPTSPGAEVYWGAARPDNGVFVATELEIFPPPGFTVTKILYPRPRKAKLDPEHGATRLIDQRHAKIRVRLRSRSDVALGDYFIPAKMKFQRIGKVEVSEPQEINFNIPVHIVGQDEKVSLDGQYYDEVTLPQKVLIILLLPFIFWALPTC